MKTLRTFRIKPACYACDGVVTGARAMHESEKHQVEAYDAKHIRPEKGSSLLPACARHADTKVKIVGVCTFCCGVTRRGGLDIDGEIAHVSCHNEACN